MSKPSTRLTRTPRRSEPQVAPRDIPTGLLTHFVLKALENSRNKGQALPISSASTSSKPATH